ncbi:DUF2235 domain-containing protein [Pseudomonadota bacterium]
MKKRIVICADGTWNRPEKDLKKDFPTNVLRIARGIKPIADDGVAQQVFYDWGVGSYYDSVSGGITGSGVQKNIMDCYRYIVQNYHEGDEIYLFGFSRGAYTVRSLCGLINNCGILKRPDANQIQAAFEHYKSKSKPYKPDGAKSIAFREQYSYPSRQVKFVGVWDTVGAMGIPFSFLGLFEDKDEFYDTKLGRNVSVARHALAIDEVRDDFRPTIWQPRSNMNIQQVWFAGVHSNIGGSYKPDDDQSCLSDIALKWMMQQASEFDLAFETHLHDSLRPNPMATKHKSKKHVYRIRGEYHRPLTYCEKPIWIHQSVKQRWDADMKYRPKNLQAYIDTHGWPDTLIE